jgi:hypothetical protein
MQELALKGARMTGRSVAAAWGVVVGLAGVLPSAGTDAVALAARQVPGALDDAAIERAIRAGASVFPPLELTDRGGLFSGAGSGYRIILYTPDSWIAHLAEAAAEAGEALSAAEIEPQDRAPLLRVFASPSAPTVGSSRDRSSSVMQVALLDERRRSSLQPQATRPFTTRPLGLLGSGALTGLEATFRLADMETLRGGAGREFFVQVEGTGYTKDFKIKRKHFNRLPM